MKPPLHEVSPGLDATMGCAPNGIACTSCTNSAPETSPEVTVWFCRTLRCGSYVCRGEKRVARSDKVHSVFWSDLSQCGCPGGGVIAVLMHPVVQQVSNTLKFFRPRATIWRISVAPQLSEFHDHDSRES